MHASATSIRSDDVLLANSNRLTEDELEKIIEWISPLDPQKRHDDIKSKRLHGTGAWFLKKPEFIDWCNESQGEHSGGESKPILGATEFRGPNFDRCYIFIDALDEFQEVHRRELLRLISTLLDPFTNSARIFFTSRPQVKASIEAAFQDLSYDITVEANDDDIRIYVLHQLDMDEAFKKAIIDNIVETADGMFLLPALQIQTVLEKTSISKRRLALNEMPKKLHKAFAATIERIARQATAKSIQGMEVLKWTFLAKRQLSIIELRHALAATNSTAESLNLDDLPFEKSLVECCYGLVTIDKETSSLRLVHKSLQDYLQKQYENKTLFSTGHCDIARTCLLYMRFNDNNITGDLASDIDTLRILFAYSSYNFHRSTSTLMIRTTTESSHLQSFPFLKYAIHFWGEHASIQIDQSVVDLAAQLLLEKDNHSRISRNLLSTALNLCSEKIPGRLAFLLEKAADIESRDVYGRTPLIMAAREGDSAMLRLLLEKGADIHSRDNRDTSPLSQAAQYGREEAFQVLLESGASIDPLDSEGRNSLSYAASRGEDYLIRRLLEKGIDVHSPDNNGRTSLSWWYGTSGISVLLDRGADLDLPNKNGRTPLSWFAVLFCLERGSDIESPNNDDRTLLSLATCGDWAISELLLERGAEIELKDENGRTPLSWAAESGNEASLHLLLDNGADILSSDINGRTPLSWAASRPGPAGMDVSGVLLERDTDADINAKDNCGEMPIFWAVRSGTEDAISDLLAKGADFNPRSDMGKTPLAMVQSMLSSEDVGDSERDRLESIEKLLKEAGATL
ncbi:ankyrin repeat-containing domain protein [Pyronema domesticum]|nr:ankyrin repeat-containing domain protein [Pyronema domesticum]